MHEASTAQGFALDLPDLPDEFTPAHGGASDFASSAMDLLASLIGLDRLVLIEEYELFVGTGNEAFPLRWQKAAMQAAALEALLLPPEPDAALSNLSAAMRSEQVDEAVRRAVAGAALGVLAGGRLPGAEEDGASVVALGSKVLEILQDRSVESSTALEKLRRSEARIDTRRGSRWLRPRKITVSEQLRQACDTARWLAERLDASDLAQRAVEVEALLDTQPYRIVLAGEIKHGKSTLFNALVGEQISPVGAGTATTAAVVELRDGGSIHYSGQWLSQERLDDLLAWLDVQSENPMARRSARSLRTTIEQPWCTPGGPLPSVACFRDLVPFLRADGEFAAAVERVQIIRPVEMLRGGCALVDTPGLNDASRIREKVSLDECRLADCVVLALRADKLGTESERKFIHALVESGRVLHLIPVVTHSDRLNPEERGRVQGEAELFVRECLPADSAHVVALKPLLVDGTQVLKAGLASGGAPADMGSALGELQERIAKAAQDPTRGQRYEDRLRVARTRLAEAVRVAVDRWLVKHEARLRPPGQLAAQRAVAAQLRTLALEHRDQVLGQLESIRARLIDDAVAMADELAATREDLLTLLAAELTAKAEQLGKKFNDKKEWATFDEEFRKRVVRPRMDRLRDSTLRYEARWRDEAGRFRGEIADEFGRVRERLVALAEELDKVAPPPPTVSSLLLRTRSFVDALDRQVAGAAVGFATGVSSTQGVGALVSGAVALLSLHGLPIVLAVGGVLYLGVKLFNVEKARAEYVKSLVEKFAKQLDAELPQLQSRVREILAGYWDEFVVLADGHFRPVIESSLAMARQLELECAFEERCRADSRALAERLASPALLEC